MLRWSTAHLGWCKPARRAQRLSRIRNVYGMPHARGAAWSQCRLTLLKIYQKSQISFRRDIAELVWQWTKHQATGDTLVPSRYMLQVHVAAGCVTLVLWYVGIVSVTWVWVVALCCTWGRIHYECLYRVGGLYVCSATEVTRLYVDG